MPGCIFQITGEMFDVDRYLMSCVRLKLDRVTRKGELLYYKNQPAKLSHCSFDISENENFNFQIKEALKFIEEYSIDLENVANYNAISLISFSMLYEESTFPYAYFPPELITKSAKYGLALEVGLFPR